MIQLGVCDGDLAGQQGLDDLAHETRGTGAGQTIGFGHAGQANILHTHLAVQAGSHAHQHTGALNRLREQHMDVVAKDLLEAKGHAAGCAAHAARDGHQQGMVCIHGDALLFQLALQTQCRNRITQEQILGVFIVHEIAHGIGIRLGATLLDSLAVVCLILDDLHAVGAQQIFFPLFGVHAHVDDDLVAHRCRCNADGHTQIAGGTHLHGVFAEKFPHFGGGQLGVIVGLLQQTGLHGQIFGVLEHLIDAAAGLYRTGDGQMAVLLEQQLAGDHCAKTLLQQLLHGGNGGQGRFDQTLAGCGFGETCLNEGGKPGKPRLGVPNVLHAQRQLLQAGRNRLQLGIEPQNLFRRRHLGQHRIFFQQMLHVGCSFPNQKLSPRSWRSSPS